MREASDIRTGAGVYLVRLLYEESPRLDAARFDDGNVIEDRHTVGVERWVARHEVALIDPEREVLDLDTRDIPR